MINLIKADVYRMLHQKSFYITMGVLTLLYFFVLDADGFQSNTNFARFNRSTDSIVDFLFYFPKSTIFVVGFLIYSALFHSETYTSKLSSTIYPLQHHKGVILLVQWCVDIMLIVILMIPIIVMALISSLFLSNAFGDLEVLTYIAYLSVEALAFASLASCLSMVTHYFHNTTLSVIAAFLLGTPTIFMILSMIMSGLHLDLDFLQYTLYWISGTLPYTFDIEAYGQAILISLGFTLCYQAISTYIIHKKRSGIN